MDPEPVIALATEGGDQRRMDVQNGVWIGVGHLLRQDGHKARQHHQADVQLLELFHQSHGHVPGAVIVGPGHHTAGNPGSFCPLQRVGPGLGGDHRGDLPLGVFAPALGVDQRLEVGAAAGNQYGNPHHSSTPFSPAMHFPMM